MICHSITDPMVLTTYSSKVAASFNVAVTLYLTGFEDIMLTIGDLIESEDYLNLCIIILEVDVYIIWYKPRALPK